MLNKIKYLIKTSGLLILIIISFVMFIIFLTGVLNDDVYGRLIETKKFNKTINKRPTITLILKKHLIEEGSIEGEIVVEYGKSSMFESCKSDKIKIDLIYKDDYDFEPYILKFNFIDDKSNYNFGYTNSTFKTEPFKIPTAVSIKGFPFDKLMIKNSIYLEINKKPAKFNLKIQKRIAGRTININNKKNIIELKRTKSEKIIILLSSFIFLILNFLIIKKLILVDLTKISLESFIGIIGYLISMIGFREFIGISRTNGVSALEFFVFFAPMIGITSFLIKEYFKKQ